MKEGGALFVDWYLVRHAPVREVSQGIYRSLDGAADLSDGEAVERAAAMLPAGARWWVSPMRRTRQTAERLCGLVPESRPFMVDQRLSEQSFGEWHGLEFEGLWERIRDLPPHNWSYLAPDTEPPGGESYRALWVRVGEFLSELSSSPDSRPRVVVTHAGVIRAIVGHALGVSPSRALALSIEPLSVSRLTQRLATPDPEGCDRGGGWQLRYLNRA